MDLKLNNNFKVSSFMSQVSLCLTNMMLLKLFHLNCLNLFCMYTHILIKHSIGVEIKFL